MHIRKSSAFNHFFVESSIASVKYTPPSIWSVSPHSHRHAWQSFPIVITARHRPVKCYTVKRVLDHIPDLTEVKRVYDGVFLLCSKMAGKILSQSSQLATNKPTILLPASVLRKAIQVHDAAFRSQGLFPDNCAQSVVPGRIKYFFRQILEGLNHRPIKKIPERVSLLGHWRCSTWDLILRTWSANHMLPSS